MSDGNGKAEKSNRFLIVCGGSGVGLLGQRNVLGIDGEMHIDVSEEVNDSLPRNDNWSVNVKLDLPQTIGTAPRLLTDMKSRIGKSIKSPKHIHHTEFLAEYYFGDSILKDGLSRSPTFGKGVVSHPDNQIELDGKLKKMITEWSPAAGPDTPIEFWIVSSTAGGTGEGTHRFIGERIAALLSEGQDIPVVLNFIRVGPATYSAVDDKATKLNTFLGVAADAAFKVRLPKLYPTASVHTNWFYLEVPPVGVGKPAIPIRARIIEVAAKAIMHPQLSDSIKTIVNNDGIGLVRVGYWGRDFDEDAKYLETLKQLDKKLEDLIDPNGELKYVRDSKREPDFRGDENLKKIKSLLTPEYLLKKLSAKEWAFPEYNAQRFPPTTDRKAQRQLVDSWVKSIDRLVSPSIRDVKGNFLIGKKEGSEGTTLGVTAIAASEEYTKEWFDKVDNAQRVRAWATYLLGNGQDDGQRLAQLHSAALKCSLAQYPSWSRRATTGSLAIRNELMQYLETFIDTLVQVVRLFDLEESADLYLESELGNAKKVWKAVRDEIVVAAGAVRGIQECPIIASELWKPLDLLTGETWLRLLDTASRGTESGAFRKTVLLGATGLTYPGLVGVLGLNPDAQINDIRKELRQNIGRMRDAKGKEFQAQWWQSVRPSGEKRKFEYRILPMLTPADQANLGNSDGDIQYLYSELGLIGLYVLAFEGMSIAEPQDTVRAPAYLLSTLQNTLRGILTDWDQVAHGKPSGKLKLVTAGCGGDSLYLPALREAGLTPDELEKISEFYDLYDPDS